MELEERINSNDIETKNFTTLNKKCAEVFIESYENFCIQCTFCFIQFNEFQQFTTHYMHEHFNESVKSLKLSNIDYENLLDVAKTELDDNSHCSIKFEICNYEEEDNENATDLNLQNDDESKEANIFDRDVRVSSSESTSTISLLEEIDKPKKFRIRRKQVKESKPLLKCEVCNIAFVRNSALQCHIQRHYGERSVPCSYCEKKFYTNAEKKTHERIHTGERPYQCDACGRCFTTSSHLLTHTRRFHEIEVEKPHKCEVCNKSFLVKGMLRKHFVIHSELRPYECDICKKTFKLQHRLRLHKQIHSDERKYECNICSKRFKQYAVLRSHMKSHGRFLGKSNINGHLN